MPRRKIHKRFIRKLTKIGKKSFAVVIPVEYIRKLKWRERQRLMVKLRGKTLTVKDWKK